MIKSILEQKIYSNKGGIIQAARHAKKKSKKNFFFIFSLEKAWQKYCLLYSHKKKRSQCILIFALLIFIFIISYCDDDVDDAMKNIMYVWIIIQVLTGGWVVLCYWRIRILSW